MHGLRRLVAVIDDDASVRGALLRFFRTAGFDVSLFAAAEAYLASPHRAEVDCLVIDVRLPGMCGLELLEQLQGHNPKPTLVISAHDDEQSCMRALRAGAVGFFRKPCDNRLLLAALYRGLGLTSDETITAKPDPGGNLHT